VTKALSFNFTSTSRAASSAISGETAATAAMSWPANLTRRVGATQTAFTPLRASAFEVSTDRTSPAGISARTIFA
jgi:hypothetical protein